ncbi:MAG: NHLP leader peptide family RiPP precursor [Rubrobacteraceae bacterium]
MSESSGNDPQEMRRRMLQRSVEDEEFRQRLLADPRATIEQETGDRLPEELEIRCVEETPDTVYLVLPPNPQVSGRSNELSANQLESVAGGWWGSCYEGTVQTQYPFTQPDCVGCMSISE